MNRRSRVAGNDGEPDTREDSDGTVQLSPRESEVLVLLARGLRSQRIAERLGIARVTVDMHITNARKKLNAATREQALAEAIVRGLIDLFDR